MDDVQKMDPTLCQAAMKGDIDVLIQYREHFGTKLTPKHNTVLHIAAMHGKSQGVVKILGICHFLFGRVNSQGGTPVDLILQICPLLGLVNSQGVTLVNMILQCCPHLLGKVNSQGETPLHIAARAGHAGIVRALLGFVDRPNDIETGISSQGLLGEKNFDDDTAFHMAVRNGHLDVVKLLLEKDSTFLYKSNKEKETPLYLAGKNGFNKIVSEILKTYPSPLYHGPKRRTVLHAAVIFGSKECTRKLLNWRTDLAKEADEDGLTPLHHAARLGHAQLVKNLLDVDKSIAYLSSGENDGKNTALHIAASQGHVKVIKVLLSSCPDCWEIDNIKGQNIFHIAVENNKYNVVKYIQNKFPLNGLINQKVNAANTSHPQPIVAPTDVPNIVTAPNEGIEALRKKADTHMIVAALIATMTFTAGLTVPGGFYGNDDPNPGMAILIKNAAFKTFTFANTGALALSVVAILCYFDAASYNDNATLTKTYKMAGLIVAQALTTMMIAFVTGIYAVLADSLFLAITNCVLGCIVVLISYAYFIGCWSGRIDGVFPEVLAYIFKLFRADN